MRGPFGFGFEFCPFSESLTGVILETVFYIYITFRFQKSSLVWFKSSSRPLYFYTQLNPNLMSELMLVQHVHKNQIER